MMTSLFSGLSLQIGLPLFLLALGWTMGTLAAGRHRRSLDRREAELRGFLVTDIRSFPGGADPAKPPTLVVAEVVIATDYMKSFLARVRKFIGGRVRSYESLMDRAQREVLVRIQQEAHLMGYDAVCNVRLQTADVGGITRRKAAAMVVLLASGTAYLRPRSTADGGSPSRDPSVFDEPHMRGEGWRCDPSEERVERAGGRPLSEDERAQQGVWDEPALSAELAGAPGKGELTYARWLAKRRLAIPPAHTWAVTLVVALLAAPWALLGAFWGSGQTIFSVLALVAFGPAVEESMKVAAAAWVVEKRPFLFRSPVQIAVCALAAGLVFSTLENLMYLHVYVPDPTPGLVAWRWSVCVLVHSTCSLIAGLGLVRVWGDLWRRMAPPRLSLGSPLLVVAIVLHGTYNGLALVLSAAGRTF